MSDLAVTNEVQQIMVPFYCPACGSWSCAPIMDIIIAPDGEHEVRCIECGTKWKIMWKYTDITENVANG